MTFQSLKTTLAAASAIVLLSGPTLADGTSPAPADDPSTPPATETEATDAPEPSAKAGSSTGDASPATPEADTPAASDARAMGDEAGAMSDEAAKEAYAAAMSAYQSGDLTTARTKLESVLSAFADGPAMKAEVRTSLARVLVERAPDGSTDADATRDREEALRFAGEATELHASGEAYNVKGRVLLEMERHDEAITAFERAVELDGDNLYAMNNLGYAMILKGQFEAAREPLEKARDLASGEAPGYLFNNLGIALEKTGDLTAARDAYETADARGNRNAAANLQRVEEKLREQPSSSAEMNTEASMDADGTMNTDAPDGSTTDETGEARTPATSPTETPGEEPATTPEEGTPRADEQTDTTSPGQ